jgi:hypothetical protein
MNCPFCGTSLIKVAAICPSCKIQLPEAKLFSYYAAALERDKSLAQSDKRAKLDSIVEKEALARTALLAEAKERAEREEAQLAAERLKSEKEMRARQAAAVAESRVKREHFLAENGKKIKAGGVVAVLAISAVVGVTNYLKPEPPKVKAPIADIKAEPCAALGTAAKKSIVLLNKTLKNFREGGFSNSEISKLNIEARNIQAELVGTTNGQTLELPLLEDVIIRLSNSLGAYGDSLVGLKNEDDVFGKGTGTIHKLLVESQKVCKEAGQGNQFKDTSGWEK